MRPFAVVRPRAPDWMKLPADDRILEMLGESGWTLSPAVIAINSGYSGDYIRDRLCALEQYDMVEREKRGYYSIAERGQQYLDGELDREDLEE